MSVVRTKQNLVCAYEAGPDDLFVQVVWHGPANDGRHMRAFEGPPCPMAEYQATLDWAVSIADQMVFPLHVVPLRAKDVLATDYIRRGVARLTGQQRGDLRRLCVATMAEVMRDCADADVRSAAYDVLVDMGVVQR